jgi:membrane-bound lytic murein transglycosylase
MNRRERKNMEKQLGIKKRKESFSECFQRVRENIQNGKKLHEAHLDKVRMQQNEKADQEANKEIASIATDLMVNKNMDYISSSEEAKKIYEENKAEKS